MRFVAWATAVLLLVIAALRPSAAWALYRSMSNVPPSRQRAARLIVLSTLSASILATAVAVTIGLATAGHLEGWRQPFFVILGLGLIGVVPGIALLLRRNREPWLEEWRESAPP